MKTRTRSREPLSRERILTTALRLVEESGVEALSMRKLAGELGVEAMSLYNHVANKDAVLDGITEAVLLRMEVPARTADWRRDARAFGAAFRRVALAHPHTASLTLTRQLESASALPLTEAALDILRRAGFDAEGAVHALRALLAYLVGTLLREVHASPTFSGLEPEGRAARERALAATGLPRVTESAAHLAVCHHEAEYDFGLELMIEALTARRPGPRSAGPGRG